MGRPKGSKNKPKSPSSPKKPSEPLISNEEQFDQLNKGELQPRAGRSRRPIESTPKKRALSALETVKWENNKVCFRCIQQRFIERLIISRDICFIITFNQP